MATREDDEISSTLVSKQKQFSDRSSLSIHGSPERFRQVPCFRSVAEERKNLRFLRTCARSLSEANTRMVKGAMLAYTAPLAPLPTRRVPTSASLRLTWLPTRVDQDSPLFCPAVPFTVSFSGEGSPAKTEKGYPCSNLL